MTHLGAVRVLVLVSFLPLLASSSMAADFPPVTDEERALTSVPGEPNAPAVVLFKKGELIMMGYGLVTGSPSSHLRVQARVKILTEAGRSNGEIVIAHTDATKLENFEARTVLPDGRALPVPTGAKFVRKTSRKAFVTAVAFPAVDVGAILDYQYELTFRSPFFLEPWYFSEDVPVRYSEIIYKTATGWQMRPWNRSLFGIKIQQEQEQTPRGSVLRAWAENLPAIPDDPYGPPYGDLATQMLLLPARLVEIGRAQPLLETWVSVSWWLGRAYRDVRQRDGGVSQQARKIAATGTSRQKAEILYRFVRDEIETLPGFGVLVDPDAALRRILSDHRGDPVEKALLLQAMLAAVQIDAHLVWAGDRNRGAIDANFPNPNWFDTVLVAVQLDGHWTFLDPANRDLGFGQLLPGHEGTTAMVVGNAGVQKIALPETPFDDNGRQAEIDLALDEHGRLSGKGSLRLTGHRAWEKLDRQKDSAHRVQNWKEWLAEQYRDFQVSDVTAVEVPEERRVVITWSMAQREEEVLGDESSVVPSAPLGPVTQPLVQSSASRKTMVMFDYADRDEVELRLRWPEGWKAESLPKPSAVENEVGALAASVELKEGERSLVYRRRFDIVRRDLRSPQEYDHAQVLFGEAEKQDAQKLLLVRR